MRTRGVRRSMRLIHEYAQQAERRLRQESGHAPLPSITISRTAGAGGAEIAERLCERLETGSAGEDPPWTPFDRGLLERVLDDQQLPRSLARHMPEDRVPTVNALLGEILGLHPSTLTLLRKTNEVILQLAAAGHAVIVGRGANFVTAGLDHVLHLRLVCSHEHAVERFMREEQLDREAAASLALSENRSRAAYVRQHFGLDVADPRHYHFVVNADRYTDDEVVDLLTNVAFCYFLRSPSS